MIILDTNVISELLRTAPSPAVDLIHGLRATRNTVDYEDYGIDVIDPWLHVAR